jgi:hypothetical protein
MRWRGQGLLTAMVLIAAATLGYQWKSMATLVERAAHEEIKYSTYTQLVAQFVEENKRWPEPHDITMPKPPHKDIIKKVTLKTNGEILFTLSGWSIQSGRVTVLLSPMLQTHSHLLPGSRNRLDYDCTLVNPASMERTLCDRVGTSTAAEVSSKNANAFAEWEKNESETKNEMDTRSANINQVNTAESQCDVRLRQLEEDITACLSRVDDVAAQHIKEHLQGIMNRPRLRPEIMLDNPDLVAEYNSACDNDWNNAVAVVKLQNAKFEACFY